MTTLAANPIRPLIKGLVSICSKWRPYSLPNEILFVVIHHVLDHAYEPPSYTPSVEITQKHPRAGPKPLDFPVLEFAEPPIRFNTGSILLICRHLHALKKALSSFAHHKTRKRRRYSNPTRIGKCRLPGSVSLIRPAPSTNCESISEITLPTRISYWIITSGTPGGESEHHPRASSACSNSWMLFSDMGPANLGATVTGHS
jgi:hypothetical protein